MIVGTGFENKTKEPTCFLEVQGVLSMESIDMNIYIGHDSSRETRDDASRGRIVSTKRHIVFFVRFTLDGGSETI